MVQVGDLTKTAEPEELYKPEKPNLLSKYQIPVQHLEYEYIENCQNGRELEKILHILKSGEEGYFPDLIKTTEKQLAEIKPTSKLLRKACPVLNKSQISNDEWHHLSRDLEDWVDDVSKTDQELDEAKVKSNAHLADSDIRRSTDVWPRPRIKNNPKRIASTDYESWDKYDPDTEMLKMDLEDERLKKEASKGHGANLIKSKTVRFNNFATEAEALFEANREKERGNECFKAEEFQTALQHYTNSLECKPLATVYTNRALVYNKLKKYELAIDDCKAALQIEPKNFKAHLRMAQNYEALEQYNEAAESVENAIEIDPNNKVAQQLATRMRKQCGKTTVNTRFMIHDIESAHSNMKENSTQHSTEEQKTEEKSSGTQSVQLSDVSNMKSTAQNEDSVTDSSAKPLKSILKTKKSNAKQNDRICEATRIKSANLLNNAPTRKVKSSETNFVKSKSDSQKPKNPKAATKHKNYEVIPIPGTSKMPPPYYKIVPSNDPEFIKREKQKILSRPMLLHMTTIEVTSDDESQGDYNTCEATGEINRLICDQTSRSQTLKAEDDLDNFHLENFKFNDDELGERHKQTWNNICGQKPTSAINKTAKKDNDKEAGGEPHNDAQQFSVPTEEELQLPYTFIETWNSIRKDTSYKQHAEILKKLDFSRIHEVIGYKLDDTMLGTIFTCLYRYFMVPGELDRLYAALTNIIRIPRFKIMTMFLQESEWKCIRQLIEFLDQHGRALPNNIRNIYSNN